jgi:hypothetical protein
VNWDDLSAEARNKPSDTLASARAAQIFAEMLGMVCHKEYIEYQQDQTVCIALPFLFFPIDKYSNFIL